MLQQSIKVSLVAASVQQLTYLDIDGLKIVKFYEHPEISAQMEVMNTEVVKYQALANSITPFEETKDSKGKDTFDL